MGRVFILITVILFIMFPYPLYAQEEKLNIEKTLIQIIQEQGNIRGELGVIKGEINVIKGELKIIKEEQKAIREEIKAIKEEQKAIRKDISNLKAGQMVLSQRLDGLEKRFGDLMFWLQMTFSAVLVVLASIIAQWIIMWRRLIRVETKLENHLAETEKDRLIVLQREEINLLKTRLDKLEKAAT